MNTWPRNRTQPYSFHANKFLSEVAEFSGTEIQKFIPYLSARSILFMNHTFSNKKKVNFAQSFLVLTVELG